LTPIDSTHTCLRFVHHLDEDAKSEEVGPGWEYYLVGIRRAEGVQRLLVAVHPPIGPGDRGTLRWSGIKIHMAR
jgi:hypothetical protein